MQILKLVLLNIVTILFPLIHYCLKLIFQLVWSGAILLDFNHMVNIYIA